MKKLNKRANKSLRSLQAFTDTCSRVCDAECLAHAGGQRNFESARTGARLSRQI